MVATDTTAGPPRHEGVSGGNSSSTDPLLPIPEEDPVASVCAWRGEFSHTATFFHDDGPEARHQKRPLPYQNPQKNHLLRALRKWSAVVLCLALAAMGCRLQRERTPQRIAVSRSKVSCKISTMPPWFHYETGCHGGEVTSAFLLVETIDNEHPPPISLQQLEEGVTRARAFCTCMLQDSGVFAKGGSAYDKCGVAEPLREALTLQDVSPLLKPHRSCMFEAELLDDAVRDSIDGGFQELRKNILSWTAEMKFEDTVAS